MVLRLHKANIISTNVLINKYYGYYSKLAIIWYPPLPNFLKFYGYYNVVSPRNKFVYKPITYRYRYRKIYIYIHTPWDLVLRVMNQVSYLRGTSFSTHHLSVPKRRSAPRDGSAQSRSPATFAWWDPGLPVMADSLRNHWFFFVGGSSIINNGGLMVV
jgi:hypothetical protein